MKSSKIIKIRTVVDAKPTDRAKASAQNDLMAEDPDSDRAQAAIEKFEVGVGGENGEPEAARPGDTDNNQDCQLPEEE